MFKKLCLVIFILTFPLFAQYSFDFICLGDTFQIKSPGELAVFYFRSENTGEELDVYEFNCTVLQKVPGWDVIFCIGGG